jgi:hypothetical protein
LTSISYTPESKSLLAYIEKNLVLGLNVIKFGKGEPFFNLAEYAKGVHEPYDSDQAGNVKLVAFFMYCYSLANIVGAVIKVITQPPITFKFTV